MSTNISSGKELVPKPPRRWPNPQFKRLHDKKLNASKDAEEAKLVWLTAHKKMEAMREGLRACEKKDPGDDTGISIWEKHLAEAVDEEKRYYEVFNDLSVRYSNLCDEVDRKDPRPK